MKSIVFPMQEPQLLLRQLVFNCSNGHILSYPRPR